MARESKADRKGRTRRIIAGLKKRYPQPDCALNRSNPLELLVATILSAQCTDKRVNIVTESLFKKHRTVADYAAADQADMESDVRTTGFFRNKAKNIRLSAAMIIERFGGEVPDTMEALLQLPGVARKTANVVLGTAFGRNDGVVVDTHVKRLADRLRLSRHTEPDKIERDLMDLVPRDDWTVFSHLLIHHGRAVCTARKTRCEDCPIAPLCPSAGKAKS